MTPASKTNSPGDASIGVSTNKRGTHFEPVQGLSDVSPIAAKLKEMEEAILLKDHPKPWIKTSKADSIFGAVIMLNSVFLGIDVSSIDRSPTVGWVFWAIESCFLFCFIAELSLRIRAELPHWKQFFDSWGIFDTTITVFGCLDAWLFTLVLQAESGDNPLNSFAVLRVLRVLRLARLIRVFRMFTELVVMIETLFRSFKAVGWIALILTIIIYTGSIICVILLGQEFSDTDEDVDLYYGDLKKALYSHFAVVTTENWPTYTDTAAAHHWIWGIYFVIVVILTNFVLVNLMVGIITENVCEAEREQDDALNSFAAESLVFRQTLQTLFNASDFDASGEITYDEVRELLKQKETIQIMGAFGLNIAIPPKTLHTIMHLNQDGVTSFDEFYYNCIRMCGSKNHIHSLFVQEDVNRAHQDLKERVSLLEQRVQRATASGSSKRQTPNYREQTPKAPGAKDHCNDENAAAVEDLTNRMERCEVTQQKVMAQINKLIGEAVQRSDGLKKASADKGVSTPAAIISGPFAVQQGSVTATERSASHPESRTMQGKSPQGAMPGTPVSFGPSSRQ
eukprot:gnl/MRDRNA2_/MRDRNA2_28157_c0_seq1.p1 gnl/MRDRNA2_/MRDRNA2_28157_c0~~gnl/MRDRNA2_/MRDRNA2_28157_c0_seq1.p1  ORF type:complete len:593 (-),score=103.51 gnl/MRDRNA2_/MRDRNA2_28157_c0_seq1:92-1789(-)